MAYGVGAWLLAMVVLTMVFMTNITVFGYTLAAIAWFCFKWGVILAVLAWFLNLFID